MLAAFLCFGLVKAQTVSGTVSDANGPLPGANVLVKGTTNGTQTDFDGNYTLNNVASNAVIVFSYVGFVTQEIAVNGRSTINVTLVEDAQALGEVVVIGYGTTTVKDATGSVSAVTSEDFNKGLVSSPEQLIQGKTAGVQITQTSGEPGAGIAVRIRGSNSIRSNNNPLFVVDGVPLSADSGAPAPGDIAFGGGAGRNPLNFLNPNDIESISILKDASATAIYGSRGANGVVIITTKSGRAGQGVFEYGSSLSISAPQNRFDLLNREQYLEALGLFGNPDPSSLDFGANTDWQTFATRWSTSHNQDFSYSNNYGKGFVRATVSYGKQFGVVEKSDQERATGRVNAQHRFFDDKLIIGLQGTISRINDQAPPLSASAGFNGDLLGAAYLANPTWPADPSFAPPGSALNPANLLEFYQSTSQTDRLLGNLSVEYKFTPELSAKVNLGYDRSEAETVSVFSSDVIGINRVSGNGQGSFNQLEAVNNLLEATVNYKKNFGNSTIDAIIGYSFQDFQREGINSQGWGFSESDLNKMGDDLIQSVNSARNAIVGSFQQFGYDANGSFVNRLFPEINSTDVLPNGIIRNTRALWGDTFDNTDELQSFFARVNYSIADKYLFTATIRADGSSRFAPDNQYGYFPSGAFAWKLSEEDFIGDAFSTLKLRLGVGITGNQEGLGFANFVARQRFGGPGITDNGTVNRPGLEVVAVDNPDLKWESTLDLNVGVDFGFGDDRFTGSLDFYRKETKDLLFRSASPAPAVDPFRFLNLEDATVLNQGVELALNYDIIDTEDVRFSTSFNISYNKNEVQDLVGDFDTGAIRGAGLTNAFAQRLTAGESVFSYFMAEFTGLDSNGLPTYADVDGNGVGDPAADKKIVGEDALPDVNTGLSLNLRVKNWDFGAYFAGQFGFSVYNATANAFFTSGSISTSRNVTVDVLNSGEAPGTSAEVSTRYLEKGDFVRLQNASVGYNVPLSGEGLFKSLRLSVTGQNLFLITDYSGLDPEVITNTGDLGSGIPTAGIDYAAFPRPRTVTFGLNATF